MNEDFSLSKEQNFSVIGENGLLESISYYPGKCNFYNEIFSVLIILLKSIT